MSKKATKEAMEALHGILASAFTDIIKNGISVVDKDGAKSKVTAPAAFFKEAREFLKDNGVESLPGANPGINNLAASLPFPAQGDEDEGIRMQ